MKTFVLTVSKVFPATHKRKMEPTGFAEKILKEYEVLGWQKIHTIRANYPFWKKRIDQVQAGEAVLSVRYWSGKPYNSKQVEICQLGKEDGVGIQEIKFKYKGMYYPRVNDKHLINAVDILSKNDGLSLEDFKEWFKGYDLSKPMAIIHFTKFRY